MEFGIDKKELTPTLDIIALKVLRCTYFRWYAVTRCPGHILTFDLYW